jgi:hypothetical protein
MSDQYNILMQDIKHGLTLTLLSVSIQKSFSLSSSQNFENSDAGINESRKTLESNTFFFAN